MDKPRTFKDLTMSEGVQLIAEIFDSAPVQVQKIGTPDKSPETRAEVEKLNKLGYGAGAFWRLIKKETDPE